MDNFLEWFGSIVVYFTAIWVGVTMGMLAIQLLFGVSC